MVFFVFGDRTPPCREYTLPREDQNSRIYATIPGQTIIGPVLQVNIIRYLDISGIEIQILSTTTKDRTSWVVICRGKNRFVEELHLNDPDHNPTSSDLLLERSVAKERELGSTKMEPSSSTEETHAKQLKIQTNPVYTHSEEVILVEERRWTDILACQQFRGHTVEAEVSKLVMRLVRRYDQHERGTDGAIHWKSMGPKPRRAFQKAGGQKFSDADWIQHIHKGSNKAGFQYRKNSRDVLLHIRAIQGHTGGNVIALGHVAIPYKWKEFFEDALEMSLQSPNQDSSLEEEKAKGTTNRLLHASQPIR